MIQIRVQGINGSDDGVRELIQIQRAYQFALNRFEHTIRDVEVWCTDINGPRGGLDKTCRVQMRLYPRGVLTARGAGSSFLQAARESCDKVRAMLAKRLSRQRSYRTGSD